MKERHAPGLLLAAGLALAVGPAAAQQKSAPPNPPAGGKLDRTVLPISEPMYPPITELVVRKVKPPPRFKVRAPKAAPNVVIVLIASSSAGHT